MKERISLFLAVLMLLAILPADVLATNTTITASTDTAGEKNIGDEVAVSFAIANNPGFAAATFVLDFNAGMLHFKGLRTRGKGTVDGILSTAVATKTDNPVKKVAWVSTEDTPADGILFVALFEVIGPGTGPVSLSIEELTSADGTKYQNDVTLIPSGAIGVSSGVSPSPTLNKDTSEEIEKELETQKNRKETASRLKEKTTQTGMDGAPASTLKRRLLETHIRTCQARLKIQDSPTLRQAVEEGRNLLKGPSPTDTQVIEVANKIRKAR